MPLSAAGKQERQHPLSHTSSIQLQPGAHSGLVGSLAQSNPETLCHQEMPCEVPSNVSHVRTGQMGHEATNKVRQQFALAVHLESGCRGLVQQSPSLETGFRGDHSTSLNTSKTSRCC